VDPQPTWRPTAEQWEQGSAHRTVSELPPIGYPASEDAVMHWFQQTQHRVPNEAEVGMVLEAMNQRDADQPATESRTDVVFLDR
jgi:hypothetical protein